MSRPIKYPLIRTERENRGPFVVVTFREDEPAHKFCGYSWCAGDCGLPAAVLPAKDGRPELKIYSDMTACGPVMQTFRLPWKGERFTIPEEFRAVFERAMWY